MTLTEVTSLATLMSVKTAGVSDSQGGIYDPTIGELWLLEVAPGAQGSRAPFAVQSAESIVVFRGVLDLTIAGRTETLHEGDALLATRTPVSAWANPADGTTEVLWSLHLAPARSPSL